MQRPILKADSVLWFMADPSMMTFPAAASGQARISQRRSGVVGSSGIFKRSLMM